MARPVALILGVLGALIGFSVANPPLLLAQATASIQARAQVLQVGSERTQEGNGRALAETLGSMIGQGVAAPEGLRNEVLGAAVTAELLVERTSHASASTRPIRTEERGPTEVRVTIHYAAND